MCIKHCYQAPQDQVKRGFRVIICPDKTQQYPFRVYIHVFNTRLPAYVSVNYGSA